MRASVGFLVISLFASATLHAAVEAKKEAKAVVFVATLQASELFETLTYPARVVPRFNTTILAETDGIVSRIYAPLGQRVSPKQRVLSITHTDPIYQYAPVNMLAPVSGIVSSVEVTEGSQVTRGQKLASVTDPSQVRVTVEVPALDLASLARGMPAELRLSGRDEPIPLKVRGISPFVDPATGTATCELELAAAKAAKPAKGAFALAPGVVGQVAFKANARKGLSIPDYAVVYRAKETLLRTVENGKNKTLPVKLGRKERGNVELLDGVKPGSTIVLRASRYVAEGEEVTVEKAEAGPAKL